MTEQSEQTVAQSLESFAFTHVHVIYDADVVSERESFITCMSPASHILAGWGENYRPDDRAIAATIAPEFTETEDDDNYDFGYLADECGNQRFAAVADISDVTRCSTCGDDTGYDWDAQMLVHSGDNAEQRDLDHDATAANNGRHRKWVALLTREQWRIFADAYCIDVSDNLIPERYEETMGAITGYGHLDAISVDNSEGWETYDGDEVISSGFYLSFGMLSE